MRLPLAALLLCPLPALAQEAEPLPCTVAAESAVIRVAVCERSGTDAEMAAFGRQACDGALPCGVWFWTDAADAPAAAPENHDGLSQAQVTSSLGVWVAEDQRVIRLEEVAR